MSISLDRHCVIKTAMITKCRRAINRVANVDLLVLLLDCFKLILFMLAEGYHMQIMVRQKLKYYLPIRFSNFFYIAMKAPIES